MRKILKLAFGLTVLWMLAGLCCTFLWLCCRVAFG